MAHSLKVAGWLLLTVLLAGCGIAPTKTSSQRLTYVLTTQQQANAAYQSGDMQHAAALYLQLTKMIPQEADYWYMLGNAYVRTQQPDQAVQAYQQALVLNPNHARAWHNLGIVRMRQAMAAFVSSASTARAEDPMHEVSTQLADELGRISLGGVNSGKPEDPVSTAPLPFTLAEFLDPLARVQHVRVSRPTAGTAAGTTAAPGTAAAKPASTDQP
jgi:tetratricopeptide (TPR) repeat protein